MKNAPLREKIYKKKSGEGHSPGLPRPSQNIGCYRRYTLRNCEASANTVEGYIAATLDSLSFGIPLPKPHRRLDTSALDPRLDKFRKSNPVRRTLAKCGLLLLICIVCHS